MLLNALARRVAAHHVRALDELEVHATDDARALSGRPDAARVLLVGSGITSGWGVQTHGLALVGALQRELQARLARPVDVEQVSALGAELASAPTVLGDRATEDWDAVVVAFGLADAKRLTSVRDWTWALRHLLAKLDGDMPAGLLVPVLVVGVPPMGSLGALRAQQPLRALIDRHGDRLNAATQAVVARNRRAAFVPLPGMANGVERPSGSPEAYRTWAEAIADGLHPLVRTNAARVDVEATAQARRPDLAALVLAPEHAPVRAALNTVVGRLAASFSADLVLLNMVQGDRFLAVARSTGEAVQSIARCGTVSDTTLRVGLVHVQDLAADARYRELEGLRRQGVHSYAGVAVRDRCGTAVGALSIINGTTSGPIDEAVLHACAAEVEAALALLATAEPQGTDAATDATRPDPAGCPVGTPPTPAGRRDEPSKDCISTGPRRRWEGPVARRRRLRTEGRRLTDVASGRTVPVEPDLWIPGADPIRVLMIGGEYSVGFGSATRAEALDGALARLLHTRTGRGVLVENRSQHLVRLHQLAAALGPAGAATFDLVVWTPTFIEAARLLLRSRWRSGIELLLRRIEATSEASVVLVGYPSLLGSQPLAVLGRARAAQVNRLLARIAARHDRVVVAEPPAIELGAVETADGPQVYHEAAVRIFPAAMELLEAAPAKRAPRLPDVHSRELRIRRSVDA